MLRVRHLLNLATTVFFLGSNLSTQPHVIGYA